MKYAIQKAIFVSLLTPLAAYASETAGMIDGLPAATKTRKQVYCELVDAQRRGLLPTARSQYPLGEDAIKRNRQLYQTRYGNRDYCSEFDLKMARPSQTISPDHEAGASHPTGMNKK
ncbi:DUF4148 domain-containing protein [Burkholderia ubonensis]|uniref:DUF4148 domain-containing protein n=1 Tax=Burkholderia ubonensis TaxID=101571 RepID=UPI0012F81944|nr:DUF4148 domain-containing protein [Burkholderia ubonensis]